MIDEPLMPFLLQNNDADLSKFKTNRHWFDKVILSKKKMRNILSIFIDIHPTLLDIESFLLNLSLSPAFDNKKPAKKIAKAIKVLHSNQCLTDENLRLVKRNRHSKAFAKALILLSKNKLLNVTTVNNIEFSDKPLNKALMIINQQKKEYKKALKIIANHPHRLLFQGKINQCLDPINAAKILMKKVSLDDSLLNKDDLSKLYQAILTLTENNIKTTENLLILKAHHLPNRLAEVFSFFENNDIYLSFYMKEQLAKSNNFDVLCGGLLHPDERESISALLKNNDLLNQENINQLLKPENDFLLTKNTYLKFWTKIPKEILTQQLLTQVLSFSKYQQPQIYLNRYIKNIFNNEDINITLKVIQRKLSCLADNPKVVVVKQLIRKVRQTEIDFFDDINLFHLSFHLLCFWKEAQEEAPDKHRLLSFVDRVYAEAYQKTLIEAPSQLLTDTDLKQMGDEIEQKVISELGKPPISEESAQLSSTRFFNSKDQAWFKAQDNESLYSSYHA